MATAKPSGLELARRLKARLRGMPAKKAGVEPPPPKAVHAVPPLSPHPRRAVAEAEVVTTPRVVRT